MPMPIRGDIVPLRNGVIPPDSNPYAMQGSSYVATSANNSDVRRTNPDDALCVSGTLGAIPNLPSGQPNYAEYWGIEVGLGLNVTVDAGTSSWDAWEPGPVVGFSFVLNRLDAGTQPLPELRFVVQPAAADPLIPHCYDVPSPATGRALDIYFADVRLECYSPSPGAVAAPPFSTLAWQLLARPGLDLPYNVCITNLRPILAD